jgi:drug/metabolite transporter (DMT)-like permease
MSEDKEEKKFLYGMMASMFCWGISWPIGKLLSSYGNPESIAFLRFLLTFVSLFLLLIVTKESLVISKKGLLVLLGASILMTLYGYLFIIGLTHGKAGAGGVLVTTLNPIITYALTMLLSLRPPSLKEIVGLLVGLLAGSVLLQIWNNSASVFDIGNIYFISATISWAFLSKLTSLSSRYGSPISFSLWMYGICSVMMYIFVENDSAFAIVKNGDAKFWLSLIFSATITTSLATTFYFYATAKIGANKASSFIFLVPLSAALGSWIILGEIPLWNTIAGGLLGIVAVFILNRKKVDSKY